MQNSQHPHHRECFTVHGFKKQKYETLDLAIAAAKKCNNQPKRIHKMVAYKCKVCFKYHIGSNGKLLKQNINLYPIQ